MHEDNGGYVRIFRSLLANPIFCNANEAMFFAYLIIKANWRDGERRYEDRIYKLRRGELVIGARKLAEEFDWSHKKVRGLLERLKEGHTLVQNWAQHGAHRAPVITICNYEKYQLPLDDGAQGGARGGHSVGTPKKEVKEKKEEEYTVASLAGQQFEVFWRAYPSRRPHSNPKAPAKKKYEAAIKRGASPADINRGATNYACYVERERVDPQFVTQAQTWLHQKRWNEYQEAVESDSRPLML